MPGNAFIQFNKYDGTYPLGESSELGHMGADGWIEISDWSWDAESASNGSQGTGSSVGKATPGNFTFTHYYDKSSPTIMAFIVKNTTFETVTVDMLKQTGTGKPQLFFQFMFYDAFISKVSSKGGEDGAVSQDIEFTFKQMAMGYKKQNDDSTLAAAKFFRWHVTEQSQATPKIKLSIK